MFFYHLNHYYLFEKMMFSALGTELSEVSIPDSVTMIGPYAFSKNDLISITIPNSVTSMDNNAFSNKPNLFSVVIEGSPSFIGEPFSGIAPNAVVYCVTGYTECEGKGANVSYYQKQNGKYVLSDGTVIGRYLYEPRLIYTLEEAQTRIKEIGKDRVKFRIRYK